MTDTHSLWCAQAWLPTGPATGVRVGLDQGRITRVESGVGAPEGDEVLDGMLLPGAANCHSHTFHRALRGAGVPGGSFWTWREDMYRIAARLTPESYFDLAVGAYAEMLEAGYTSVGEFHYVHHRPDGTPYADPNAMGEALISAAREVGIRLTLLDTCYLSSGFGATLAPEQVRFGDASDRAWRARVDDLAAAHPGEEGVRIGAAIHSVRAVDPQDMQVVAARALARLCRQAEALCSLAQENPLFTDRGVRHHGAFLQAALAQELSSTCRALAQTTTLTLSRIRMLNDPDHSGLPAFLSTDTGGASGTIIIEYIAGSGAGRVRGSVNDLASHSVVISRGMEEDASFVGELTDGLARAAGGMEVLVACELLEAVRALRLGTRQSWEGTGVGHLLEACAPLPSGAQDRDLQVDVDLALALVAPLGQAMWEAVARSEV